jgi:glycerol-3-phosphate O-acyltransferase
MVISWLFFQKGISMPFVAAGENLDMPIVGSLLQGSGAFFIRRQFGTDPLYRVVFHEYITQVLIKGYNLEFFMEGGRSRTGKLLNPKMGLLSVVCDAFFAGKLKDAYIVPVWIGYDKVIETEGYIQEMLGRAKPPESLLQLLRAIELLKLNFGALEVRFGEAYSLKEAVGREEATRGLQLYTPGPEETRLRARRQLVNVLAYQTMYKINMVSAALPTSLVVTVLLTHEGRGLSKTQLVQRVAWLRQEITKRGGTVCHLQGNPASVVDQVAVLLGSAIGRHTHLLETVYTPIKRFELSYYRNSLIHFFVSESIIACCLYSFRINGARQMERISKSELMHAAQYLSRLLKHEFIYKPLPDFADTFEECLSWMISEGIVSAENKNDVSSSSSSSVPLHMVTTSSHNDASTPSSSSSSSSSPPVSESGISNHHKKHSSWSTGPGSDLFIRINDDNHMFKFLCFLLWPFVECYWMVAASLQGLFPNQMVEEAEFIKSIQKFGETLYYEGELNFYESVSKETTKLALTRFYERKVIVKRVINDRGAAVVHLGDAYAKDEAKLIKFSNKIAQYRRKGKYRTAHGTVDTKAIASLIPGSSRIKAKL